MRLKRALANVVMRGFGLGFLAGGRVQRGFRAFLDELDVQRMRAAFEGKRIDPSGDAPGDDDVERARDNFHVFVAANVGTTLPIDYLEFGVYKGHVIGRWAEMNTNPASRFVGFDSFEGLPVDWKGGEWGSKGSFDMAGQVPDIGDERVSFQKGWFDETVPAFTRTFRSKRRLVVHLDADLYLSTILPLVHLGPFMKPGTMLIFDEFVWRDDEFKAWQDFRRMFPRLRFRGVAQANQFSQVCFEVTESVGSSGQPGVGQRTNE
jgi:hypothetical protein